MISPVLRAIVTVFVLIAAGGLVTGCGSSDSGSAGGGTYGGSAQVTKAQAVAYADAVNLRAADDRGLVVAKFPRRRETMSGPFGTVVEGCDGMGAHAGGTIGIVSRRFQRNNAQQQGERFSDSLLPFESVRSAVYVMGSAALASREIATAASARGRMCLKRFNVSHNATIVPEGAKAGESPPQPDRRRAWGGLRDQRVGPPARPMPAPDRLVRARTLHAA